MKSYINFPIVLICKRLMIIVFLIFILGACSSQKHRPKHKPNKNKRGCDCPHFSQGFFIDNIDNIHTIHLYEING